MQTHKIVVPQEGRDELNAKLESVDIGQDGGALVSYQQFVHNLFKTFGCQHRNLVHATVGINTECGEILDIAKKVWVYGKQLNVANLVEELGDLRFYFQAAKDVLIVGGVVGAWPYVGPAFKHTPEDAFLHVCSKMSVYAGQVLDDSLTILDSSGGENVAETFASLKTGLGLVLGCYEALLRMLDLQDGHIRAHNMYKLSLGENARFPNGVYTDAAAIARADKAAEGETAASGLTGGE